MSVSYLRLVIDPLGKYKYVYWTSVQLAVTRIGINLLTPSGAAGLG